MQVPHEPQVTHQKVLCDPVTGSLSFGADASEQPAAANPQEGAAADVATQSLAGKHQSSQIWQMPTTAEGTLTGLPNSFQIGLSELSMLSNSITPACKHCQACNMEQ
jgi:hypothetical protein